METWRLLLLLVLVTAGVAQDLTHGECVGALYHGRTLQLSVRMTKDHCVSACYLQLMNGVVFQLYPTEGMNVTDPRLSYINAEYYILGEHRCRGCGMALSDTYLSDSGVYTLIAHAGPFVEKKVARIEVFTTGEIPYAFGYRAGDSLSFGMQETETEPLVSCHVKLPYTAASVIELAPNYNSTSSKFKPHLGGGSRHSCGVTINPVVQQDTGTYLLTSVNSKGVTKTQLVTPIVSDPHLKLNVSLTSDPVVVELDVFQTFGIYDCALRDDTNHNLTIDLLANEHPRIRYYGSCDSQRLSCTCGVIFLSFAPSDSVMWSLYARYRDAVEVPQTRWFTIHVVDP